jgi:hypothetical protein
VRDERNKKQKSRSKSMTLDFWPDKKGKPYQSLVNEILAEEMRKTS